MIQLFLWPFSIVNCNKLPGRVVRNSTTGWATDFFFVKFFDLWGHGTLWLWSVIPGPQTTGSLD